MLSESLLERGGGRFFKLINFVKPSGLPDGFMLPSIHDIIMLVKYFINYIRGIHERG